MTRAFPPLIDVLAAHGLAGVSEQHFEHGGYSGAAITHLARDDGARFVLKRMSLERDWIMRATDDAECREAAFARATIDLPGAVAVPSVAVARDGAEYALLMHDITADLLPQTTITPAQFDQILAGMAALHATPPPAPGTVPWCGLRQRLTLLTPTGALVARSYGAPVAADLLAGWRLFDRHATPAAARLIHDLFDDPSPLLRALDALPPAFLHGDVKLDNVGLAPDGKVWLIDWAMTLIAPPAVEVGWFLAINSRRIPAGLDAVIDAYAAHARLSQEHRARHDALTVLCGLLLRGWRKALDAESGDPAELLWWCQRAEAAAAFL